jgi:hypothetical protein
MTEAFAIDSKLMESNAHIEWSAAALKMYLIAKHSMFQSDRDHCELKVHTLRLDYGWSVARVSRAVEQIQMSGLLHVCIYRDQVEFRLPT